MNDIFYLLFYYPKIMCLFQKMVTEILFNKKIQILSFETIHIFTHTYIIIFVHF
jgi:hypothetical protein